MSWLFNYDDEGCSCTLESVLKNHMWRYLVEESQKEHGRTQKLESAETEIASIIPLIIEFIDNEKRKILLKYFDK